MILENAFDNLSFWKGGQRQVLDVFFWASGKKIVDFGADAAVTYVFVVGDSDVDLQFDLRWEYAHLELFGIFVGDVKSQVLTSLLANKTFANVTLFSIVKENATVYVDGNIVIWKDVEKVEGHLAEEQFLLWQPKHLFVRPVLDVQSNDVKASHGAKIHTLDQQKLFYMMSKGLSLEKAQWIVIQSWLQAIFDKLDTLDAKKKQTILNQIFESIFTSWMDVW